MKNLHVISLSLAVGALVGAGIVAAEEEEHDTPVAQKDVPAAVMKTAVQYADGATFDSAVLADEDGFPIYEIHFKKGDHKLEVQTTKAGDLFAREERVDEAALPDFVKQRVAKLFKPGSKVSYERTMIVLYEVAAKDASGKETEYLVSQAGVAMQEISGGIGEENAKKK